MNKFEIPETWVLKRCVSEEFLRFCTDVINGRYEILPPVNECVKIYGLTRAAFASHFQSMEKQGALNVVNLKHNLFIRFVNKKYFFEYFKNFFEEYKRINYDGVDYLVTDQFITNEFYCKSCDSFYPIEKMYGYDSRGWHVYRHCKKCITKRVCEYEQREPEKLKLERKDITNVINNDALHLRSLQKEKGNVEENT